MNSLRTVFVIAILGAVACGAYWTITRKQESAELGSEAPPFVVSGVSQAPGFGSPSGASAGAMPGVDAGAQLLPPADSASPVVPAAASTPYAGEPGAPSVSFPSDPNAVVAAVDLSKSVPTPLTYPAADPPATPPGRDSLPSDSLAPPAAQVSGSPSVDDYAASLAAIQRQLGEGRLKQAHLALTELYNRPGLRPYQRSQIADLLDQLAGHVVYSREHLLEPPHVVQASDTLETIAQSYNIPWQLLANINGIGDPHQLRPGQQLKVVRGPFNAVVNLSDYEMMLTVGGCYAGRFAIGVGKDCAQVANPQTFLVSGKTANPTYYGPGNEQTEAGDPNNPLGRYYLSLSEPNGAPTRISIHGTNSPVNLHQTGGRGSICLGAQDVKDIFEILSAGPVPPNPNGPVASKVTIVR